MNELEDFLHGIVDSMDAEKLAADDLSCLSEDELAFLAFGDDQELLNKIAEGGWPAADEGEDFSPTDTQQKIEGIRRKKAGVDVPGNVSYDGNVNTGETDMPSWPAAALGAESAGRRATDEEKAKQDDTSSPQHTTPKTAYFKAAELPAGQENAGAAKAMKGLAKAKMDPDRKAALAKGLAKNLKTSSFAAKAGKAVQGLGKHVESGAKRVGIAAKSVGDELGKDKALRHTVIGAGTLGGGGALVASKLRSKKSALLLAVERHTS